MKATDYSVLIIWSNEDQAFLAQVLELPGCVADGVTREEALANATIAAENWIETAQKVGREIPKSFYLERYERLEADLQEALERALVTVIQPVPAAASRDA